MRKELLAAGLTATLALNGCGSGEQEPSPPPTTISTAPTTAANPVRVKNIRQFPIEISDNPNTATPATRRGFIEAGQTALAKCLVPGAPGYPEATSLLVETDEGGKGVEGYIGVYSAGTKTEDNELQLEPGLATLQAQLPEC